MQTRYPEPVEVMQHIVAQLKSLPFADPQVVELDPGSGLLAERLLRELPRLTNTSFDSSELLLAFARTKLAPSSHFLGPSLLAELCYNMNSLVYPQAP